MKTLKFFALIWLAISLLARTSFAQAGNDNPTGVAGFFNGNVTTGGSYDPYTGNATRSVTDLVVAGSVGAYPLAFTRTANSRYTPGLSGEFAEPGGWRHSYQWSIDGQVIYKPRNQRPMPQDYTINFPDGRREIFGSTGSDMRAAPGTRERFQPPTSRDGGDCFLLLPDGGKVWFYMWVTRTPPPEDVMGPTENTFDFELKGIIDPHGLVTTITATDDGGMKISEPTISGEPRRWLKLFYARSTIGKNELVLDRVTASDGRTVEYQYWEYTTSTGVKYSALTNVFYNIGPEWATYSYQDDNLDPSGRPLLRTCSDPMFAGPMWRIGYTFVRSGDTVVAGQLQSENYISPWGAIGVAVSTLHIDDANAPNIRTETRGDGPTRTFTYSIGRLVSWTDFKNVSASQTYNTNGGFVDSITDRRGNVTNFMRDAVTGNTTTKTFPPTPPDNQRATIQVLYGGASCTDPNNQDGNNPYYVCSVTNERGFSTKYFRDNHKRVTRIEYPDGGIETFQYNTLGQIITHGLTSGGTEVFEYDDATGRLVRYRDPYHLTGTPTARYQYDSRGRISGVTDARGTADGDPNFTTNYEYDFRGQLTKITHPIHPGTSFRYFVQNQYNPNGTLKAKMNERGHTTEYTYDDYKRVTFATPPVAYSGDTTPRISEFYYTRNGAAGSYDYSHTDANPGAVVSPGAKWLRILYDENVQKRLQIVGLGAENATTTYTYDAVGNLKTVKDPMGQTTGLYMEYFYDARNRQTDANDPIAGNRNNLGYTVSWTYDPAGNKKSELRANDQLITYDTYDSMNRLMQQTVQREAGVADITRMTYDLAGNLLTFEDGRGSIYNYGHDYMSRRTSLTYPADDYSVRRAELYHYDIANNMDTYTNRAGAVQTVQYDNRNRQTHYSWSDGSRAQWATYDPVGNVTNINNGVDTVECVYDWRDRKTSETQVAGIGVRWTVGYTYDADSNRKTLTHPAGHTFTYHYTTRNQLKSVTDNLGAVASYTYDLNGNRTTRTLRNGTSTTYAPDPLNRPMSIEHRRGATPFGRFDYHFDKVSRIDWVKRDSARGDAYAYDLADQLKTAQFDALNVDTGSPAHPANATSLAYDANGNWTSKSTFFNAWTYQVNYLNQYSYVNAARPSYDANGNLGTYDQSVYSYDAHNRLTSASMNGNFVPLYYDALGRQILRGGTNGQWIYSIWDGWDLIAEYNDQNVLLRSYVHGAGTDEMVARFNGGPTIWYHQDAQGSTTHLTDDWGNVVERYKYDPASAGAPSIYDASGGQISASAFDNRFLYTGRDWIKEVGLYDYRMRFYLPALGRFLQPDPIGFAGDPTNLYRYCGGDPANKTDPTGLSAVKEPPPKRPVDGRFSLDARDALTGLGGGDWFSGSFTFTDVEKALHQADVFMNAIASLESLTFGAAFRDSGGSGGDGESGSGRGQYIPVLRFNEALAHYMGGSGSTIQTSFNQLSANIRARDFPLIAFLINASHNWPGTLTAYVSDRRAFSTTGSNNQNVFGTVTFRLTGVISATNGSYSFSGRLSALNDRYNFDPKPSGARTLWNEFKTWAGSHVPGRPYEIQFVGDRPFSESGP
jgi:RHS repeat-associated protein